MSTFRDQPDNYDISASSATIRLNGISARDKGLISPIPVKGMTKKRAYHSTANYPLSKTDDVATT